MKIHRHDTAIVFPDPQDKVLSGKARGWPLAIRKITRSLYTFLNFGLAMFALNANSFAASAAKKSSPVTKPTIVLVHGAFAAARLGLRHRDRFDRRVAEGLRANAISFESALPAAGKRLKSAVFALDGRESLL